MVDTYSSFDELSAHEVEGRDFTIIREKRDSNVLIMAPHGGKIEKWTSEIALALAGNNYSYYIFEGKKFQNNYKMLHITSTCFDEPKALEIASSSDYIVAIHGERNTEKEIVYIGGMNKNLREEITRTLTQNEFLVEIHKSAHLQGTNINNICNRSKYNGVQLELTYKLREKLHSSSEVMTRFTSAVREGLSSCFV
ncbi:poly-gamma-glutamate hydrolase family protein [Photobacterium damselae subsp. damselae]|uniref:poly-gamma-glutamate hydrolase family protein n=1 Tax=Photobacterium damselae TaxID=38293 RepID=UPI0023421947|nr:poly-gamma-glutamate hydrolase family protein [Photobacterium damselae]MDC4168309.1 poly-gamma-glutamate hydrolase family protein [Photobacterium damselae]